MIEFSEYHFKADLKSIFSIFTTDNDICGYMCLILMGKHISLNHNIKCATFFEIIFSRIINSVSELIGG